MQGSSIFDADLGDGDGHMLFSLQGGPHGSAHVKDEQVQRFAYPGAHHPPTQTDLRMCSGGAGVAGGLDPTAAGVHNTPAGYFGSPSPLYGFGQSNGFAHPVAQHPSTHHDLHACSGGAGVAGGLDPTAAGVRNTPAGYFSSPPPLHGFGQPNGFGALNYPTGDMVAMHAAMQEVQRNHAMQRRTAMQMPTATQMPTAPQSCHASLGLPPMPVHVQTRPGVPQSAGSQRAPQLPPPQLPMPPPLDVSAQNRSFSHQTFVNSHMPSGSGGSSLHDEHRAPGVAVSTYPSERRPQTEPNPRTTQQLPPVDSATTSTHPACGRDNVPAGSPDSSSTPLPTASTLTFRCHGVICCLEAQPPLRHHERHLQVFHLTNPHSLD